MTRKTNIFYTSGEDSKFLTFDNYTESLTGDILVMDAKLFPSRFICVNIPGLVKNEFIKDYLENYYENKLAVLRDNLSEEQKNQYLNPLGYLIDAILKYNEELNGTPVENSTDIFTFIGNIVEMDYNGTYTDIICTINPNGMKKPTINLSNDESSEENLIQRIIKEDSNDSKNTLYGWYNANGQIESYLQNRDIIYDLQLQGQEGEEYYYNVKSNLSSIGIPETKIDTVSFNMIIPLFQFQNLSQEPDYTEGSEIIPTNNKEVPLGIYFCDKPITLSKDINTGFSPNWSLMISMQFAPFPYSYQITSNFDEDEIVNSYSTFAEILSRQTGVIDLVNKYNSMMIDLKTKINQMESAMNNISSVNNIDDLTKSINDIKISLEDKFSEYDQRINDLTQEVKNSKLTWTIKNN